MARLSALFAPRHRFLTAFAVTFISIRAVEIFLSPMIYNSSYEDEMYPVVLAALRHAGWQEEILGASMRWYQNFGFNLQAWTFHGLLKVASFSIYQIKAIASLWSLATALLCLTWLYHKITPPQRLALAGLLLFPFPSVYLLSQAGFANHSESLAFHFALLVLQDRVVTTLRGGRLSWPQVIGLSLLSSGAMLYLSSNALYVAAVAALILLRAPNTRRKLLFLVAYAELVLIELYGVWLLCGSSERSALSVFRFLSSRWFVGIEELSPTLIADLVLPALRSGLTTVAVLVFLGAVLARVIQQRVRGDGYAAAYLLAVMAVLSLVLLISLESWYGGYTDTVSMRYFYCDVETLRYCVPILYPLMAVLILVARGAAQRPVLRRAYWAVITLLVLCNAAFQLSDVRLQHQPITSAGYYFPVWFLHEGEFSNIKRLAPASALWAIKDDKQMKQQILVLLRRYLGFTGANNQQPRAAMCAHEMLSRGNFSRMVGGYGSLVPLLRRCQREGQLE